MTPFIYDPIYLPPHDGTPRYKPAFFMCHDKHLHIGQSDYTECLQVVGELGHLTPMFNGTHGARRNGRPVEGRKPGTNYSDWLCVAHGVAGAR
jgi:hypothetical protein